jgi:hypothetical protein
MQVAPGKNGPPKGDLASIRPRTPRWSTRADTPLNSAFGPA